MKATSAHGGHAEVAGFNATDPLVNHSTGLPESRLDQASLHCLQKPGRVETDLSVSTRPALFRGNLLADVGKVPVAVPAQEPAVDVADDVVHTVPHRSPPSGIQGLRLACAHHKRRTAPFPPRLPQQVLVVRLNIATSHNGSFPKNQPPRLCCTAACDQSHSGASRQGQGRLKICSRIPAPPRCWSVYFTRNPR